MTHKTMSNETEAAESVPHSVSAAVKVTPGRVLELRNGPRYPIDAVVQITVIPRKGEEWKSQAGRSVDMSSHGILFTCDTPLEKARLLKLSLWWPVPLEGGAGLQLFMRAKVARTDGNQVGAEIIGYEFRTRPLQASHFQTSEGVQDQAHLWQYLKQY